MTETPRSRRQAGVEADEGAAIGLVGALRRRVRRTIGELLKVGVDAHLLRTEAELRPELVRLGEVVLQDDGGLSIGGVQQRVRGDEGVAVAVATDPTADAKEGR